MNLLYFAWLRSKTGVGAEEIQPPVPVSTVGELVTWLKSRTPGFADAFSDMSLVRVAVNQNYVGLDHPVSPQDEIAFFPPVTGG